ncbi:MAG: pyridoxal phosphate-dependent aminotransferase [Oscillospiraceae bacterium]|nr:pyridoxal phosphate-dependent aminotransferase [Oscillospiraceae bacterium]
MEYNFDRLIDRRGTDCIKYDGAVRQGKPADILPLWVADMDFPAPPAVLDAMTERVRHGIFGYSEPAQDYFDALKTWFTGRFGYTFNPKWVVLTSSVVSALCTAIRAYTNPEDAVLIQEPVYHPFRESILANDRRLVVNTLQLTGDAYTIDFADFERQIAEHQVKLFILCSPHNPVGRVWRVEELRELVRICMKYDVLIFSDEIHCDFVFPGHTHHVLPALIPEAAERMILSTSPSKTFNLAGLHLANTFIPDRDLRRAFCQELNRSGLSQASSLGLVACRAAYNGGAAWLDALLAYLAANMAEMDRFLKANFPSVRLIPPEGTYLAWVDCRSLGLSADALDYKLTQEAKVWLNRGDTFGPTGAGFVRINTACPRKTLETCLTRLAISLGV